MDLIHDKEDYLKGRFNLKTEYGSYEADVPCEICEKKLGLKYRISRKRNIYEIKVNGEFHHDTKEELHLLCYECHKRIHDWGLIQRWLKKMGKTVEDLPDAIGLSAIRRTYG